MSTIAAPSLAKAIGTTFGTYCIADFLSNFIQHPTQKMDYGVFNKMIGREVQSDFWGTRTEHIGEYDLIPVFVSLLSKCIVYCIEFVPTKNLDRT